MVPEVLPGHTLSFLLALSFPRLWFLLLPSPDILPLTCLLAVHCPQQSPLVLPPVCHSDHVCSCPSSALKPGSLARFFIQTSGPGSFALPKPLAICVFLCSCVCGRGWTILCLRTIIAMGLPLRVLFLPLPSDQKKKLLVWGRGFGAGQLVDCAEGSPPFQISGLFLCPLPKLFPHLRLL